MGGWCWVWCLIALSLSADALRCGFVLVPREEQVSTNRIFASWESFSEQPSKVDYDWCIISDSIATDNVKNYGEEPNPLLRCRTTPGFSGNPDVSPWQETSETAVRADNLKLEVNQTYYVVVRAMSEGKVLYSNSKGVLILDQEEISHHPKPKHNASRHSDLSSSSYYSFSSDSSLSSSSSSGGGGGGGDDDDDDVKGDFEDDKDGLKDYEIGVIITCSFFVALTCILLALIFYSRYLAKDKYNKASDKEDDSV